MIRENSRETFGWSFEIGYSNEFDRSTRSFINEYPYRSFNTRSNYGFSFRSGFRTGNDSENTCGSRLPGSRFFMNVPGEHPITSNIRGLLHSSIYNTLVPM